MGIMAGNAATDLNKRRDFTRVLFTSDALIKLDNQTINGQVADVCLKGLRINTSVTIPNDSRIMVTIFPSQAPNVTFDAKVVWAEQSEMGVEIARMPVESFSWLRSVVTNRALDPEGVINEVYKVARCID